MAAIHWSTMMENPSLDMLAQQQQISFFFVRQIYWRSLANMLLCECTSSSLITRKISWFYVFLLGRPSSFLILYVSETFSIVESISLTTVRLVASLNAPVAQAAPAYTRTRDAWSNLKHTPLLLSLHIIQPIFNFPQSRSVQAIFSPIWTTVIYRSLVLASVRLTLPDSILHFCYFRLVVEVSMMSMIVLGSRATMAAPSPRTFFIASRESPYLFFTCPAFSSAGSTLSEPWDSSGFTFLRSSPRTPHKTFCQLYEEHLCPGFSFFMEFSFLEICLLAWRFLKKLLEPGVCCLGSCYLEHFLLSGDERALMSRCFCLSLLLPWLSWSATFLVQQIHQEHVYVRQTLEFALRLSPT